ncbi:hypothetical protein D4764_09G0004840 [Takifugu flavidus]|uniref:Tc1-like transposase DDE domain-containing protein n=1 Tax=Takifugu flavidus TaxID=433684 RepID=A0A5C6MLB5_9TELE|nr:hypothetical protein D4764_09G0004840 [Takifugu flavidus]
MVRGLKELRYHFVQRMMELEASEPPCHFIYMDEAGFNLTKRRRRGRNLMDIETDVPGQRGGNITIGARNAQTQSVKTLEGIRGTGRCSRVGGASRCDLQSLSAGRSNIKTCDVPKVFLS